MTKNTITKKISFFEFRYYFPSFTRHLRHHIVTIRINLLSHRNKRCHSLGFEKLLESSQYRTNSINKCISFYSLFELHGSFKIIYLCEERSEHLGREKKCHIYLVSLDSHQEILIICLRPEK